MITINKKIVSYQVKADNVQDELKKGMLEKGMLEKGMLEKGMLEKGMLEKGMHEKIERPEFLFGSTYKIKTPDLAHALYVTINDMILNQGTQNEKKLPFEIFINSKNMNEFQWVVALTRIMSAVFRKGGDVAFLVDEMKAVFDPRGGYFKPGGVFVPSLIAEIGMVLEKHLKSIGLIHSDELDLSIKSMISSKKEQIANKNSITNTSTDTITDFPKNSTMCEKCYQKSMIIMDGCQTCLNCGNSKCG